MTRKMKRTITVAIVGVAATTTGLVWWLSGAKAAVEAPPQTVAAKTGPIMQKVSSTGVVEPEFTVEIKSKASGTVDAVKVQEGDKIRKGALLVAIDPIIEQRKVIQARAEVRIAQMNRRSAIHKLNYAIAQLKRERGLLKKGLVSKDTVQALQKEVAVLRGEVSVAASQMLRAREALREAKDRLSETKITSPITGTVLERAVQPGQIVASGTNSLSGGTTLLKIADLSRLFVRVKVDEADIVKVKPGKQVFVSADALPGRRFEGRVRRVAPQGRIESNVTIFDVVVEVSAKARRFLRPMMTANVEIIAAKRDAAVLLPVRAVRRSRRGNRRFVAVPKEGRRRVEIGITDGKNVEIVRGVAAGEKVELPRPGAARKRDPRQRNRMRGMRRMMRR